MSTESIPRESGYYWVKKHGGWIIRLWWDTTGIWSDGFSDIFYDEIDETPILRDDTSNAVKELTEALSVAHKTIEELISSKAIRNLDEILSDFRMIIQKHTNQ